MFLQLSPSYWLVVMLVRGNRGVGDSACLEWVAHCLIEPGCPVRSLVSEGGSDLCGVEAVAFIHVPIHPLHSV